MDQHLYTKDIQKELSPFLDYVLLIGSIANFLSVPLIYFFEQTNKLFTYYDSIIAIALLVMFLFRKKIPIFPKVLIVILIIMVHAVLSLYGSGLIGTGLLALLLLQVIIFIFLPLRPAIILGIIALLILVTFTVLIRLGLVTYGFSLIIRMNNTAHWSTVLISIAFISAVIGGAISYLKNRLLENIEKLKESNLVLAESNQTLRDNRIKLEHLAYYDTLTGLFNRNRFEELVNQSMASQNTSGFLILVNIRNFRIINSIFGSEMGDQVLRTIGSLFSQYQNKNNFIARLHGDEFAGWAKEWDEETLENRMRKFRHDIVKRLPKELDDLHLDFYVAAAAYPEDGKNFEECFRKAGTALKIAKETGTAQIRHFHHSMIRKAEQEMRMRSLLQHAIDHKEFTICYQNKMNIHSGQIVGVEALARWHSKELGNVSPAQFIPVIRNAHLMVPFSQTIIDIIFDEIPSLYKKLGDNIPISINTSPLLFLKPGFTEYITDKIRSAHIEPGLITLEITEDVFIENITRIQNIISELHQYGINIALDDFGKGFSSIYYISQIQVNELKVDKAFIDKIAQDQKSFEIFSSICDFAAGIGYKTVAEGVETKEQVEKIKQTRCEVVQGYYFSRPEPI